MLTDQQQAAWKQYIADQYAKRSVGVPPHIKQLLDQMEPVVALGWMEENADKIKAAPVDEIAAQVAELTPERLQGIARMGMSPEAYVQSVKGLEAARASSLPPPAPELIDPDDPEIAQRIANLTPAQLEMASAFGISPDVYVQRMTK